MWGYELGPLGVFRIVAAGNTMIRTSRAIAAGDPECMHVSVILAGQLNAAQSGRHCVVRAGDMMSYETSRPVVLQADQPFETLVVRVPRRLLGGHAEKIGNLTAVKRSGSEPLPRATAAYLNRVAHRLEQGRLGAGGRCADGRARPRSHPQPVRGRSRREMPRAGPARRSSSTSSRSSRPTSAIRSSIPRTSPARRSSRRGTCTSCSPRRAQASAGGYAPRGSKAVATTWSIRRFATTRS